MLVVYVSKIDLKNNFYLLLFKMKNILKKLLAIQCELKCKKDKQASSYKYRSAEDILENLKPILEQTETTLIMKDEVVEINGSSYFKTTVTLYDLTSEESIENYSYTKEWSNVWVRKDWTQYEKMSEWQLSGATISYCRKYALCWMFAIDDGEDLDSQDKKEDKSESKTTIQRLEEARDNSMQMLYNWFKERVENIDMENEKAVLRILDEWRNLVKYGTEEMKREVTEICIGIKKVLDERKKENGN